MEIGIAGAATGLIVLLITIFLIRFLSDLIIALCFFGTVAIPFVLGSGGFPPEQMFLYAIGLGNRYTNNYYAYLAIFKNYAWE